MKIAILDDYQDAVSHLKCFNLLKDHEVTVLTQSYASTEELAGFIADVDAIVLIRERTRISTELLAQLPNLKLISQTGKISKHLDLSACTRAKVAVAEGVGSPVAPAELCWALVLAASRHIPAYSQNLKEGKWQNSGALGLGRSLYGLTFGVWGYGKIGKRVARYANAFGMEVLVWGSPASRIQAKDDGFNAASSKADFFRSTDVLSLHLRLNEATRHCVLPSDLQSMKSDALFVNMSRAELVAPNALYDALVKGNPGFAAVDVFDSEPADARVEPLIKLPNVLCTPHLGYVEQKSYALYFKIAFENVVNYFNGQPSNIANPEVTSL